MPGWDTETYENMLDNIMEPEKGPEVGLCAIEFSKNGVVEYEDHGDYVTFKGVKIAAEGVMNGGLRTKKETLKMLPFCNGLPVVIDHPELDIAAMAVLDLKDPEHPAIGWTNNAKESDLGGISRAETDLNIYKKDRLENDLMPIINALASGDLKNVSIGYFFERVVAKGNAYGEDYDHEEVDIRPTHLAILTDAEPACGGPICGVGVASKTSRSRSSTKGGNEMVGQPGTPPSGGTETPPVVKTNAEPISVKDMSICALTDANPHVKDLVKKFNDLEEKHKTLGAEKKKSDEAVEELEAIKKKEREEKEKAVKEGYSDEAFEKLFPEDAITKIGEDELSRHLVIVEALKAQAEADPAPASETGSKKVNEADRILKGAGLNVNTPPHNKGLTAGDPCEIEPYKPITKENYK